MIISVVIDLIDFVVGKIPGIKEGWDVIMIVIAMALWDEAGILAVWEMFDITGLFASEIPSLTVIGLVVLATRGKS